MFFFYLSFIAALASFAWDSIFFSSLIFFSLPIGRWEVFLIISFGIMTISLSFSFCLSPFLHALSFSHLLIPPLSSPLSHPPRLQGRLYNSVGWVVVSVTLSQVIFTARDSTSLLKKILMNKPLFIKPRGITTAYHRSSIYHWNVWFINIMTVPRYI